MKIRISLPFLALALIAIPASGGSIAGVNANRVANAPQFVAGETTGPDGNVWFVAWKDNAIGRLSPDGSIALYPLPTPNSNPDQITAGQDGNLWFTELSGRVGRITPQGVITEFPIASSLDGQRTIVSGSDGAVWFFDYQFPHGPGTSTVKLGRITSDGTLTTYDLGTSDTFVTMASGPDGALWMYDSTKNSVMTFSVTKRQVAATYTIPTPVTGPVGFHNNLVQVRGNMWLTHGNSLVRITPDGAMTDYPVPTANALPSGLVDGGDGSLWFTEYSAKKLGQLILSTATDDGHATINESDPVLGNGSLDLTLLTGPTPLTAPSATGIAPAAITYEPCVYHTAVSWHTVEGVWVAITWQAGPNNRCADLAVHGQISVQASDKSKRSEFATGKTRIHCGTDNDGPSAATNVTYLCNVFGASIIQNGASINRPKCTFTPTAKGVTIHADSLGISEACGFDADLQVIDDSNFGMVMNAWSDEVDPLPYNNIGSNFYSLKNGHAVNNGREIRVPVGAPIRGH